LGSQDHEALDGPRMAWRVPGKLPSAFPEGNPGNSVDSAAENKFLARLGQ